MLLLGKWREECTPSQCFLHLHINSLGFRDWNWYAWMYGKEIPGKRTNAKAVVGVEVILVFSSCKTPLQNLDRDMNICGMTRKGYSLFAAWGLHKVNSQFFHVGVMYGIVKGFCDICVHGQWYDFHVDLSLAQLFQLPLNQGEPEDNGSLDYRTIQLYNLKLSSPGWIC